MLFFFFFQAKDGIRDGTVTGVQTCALPICPLRGRPCHPGPGCLLGDRAAYSATGLLTRRPGCLLGGRAAYSAAGLLRARTTITSDRPGVSQGRLASPVSCSSSLHGTGDDAG